MPVFVVLSCESLLVVFAVYDRALLGSLQLVSKHMSFKILEDPAAIRKRTSALLFIVIVEIEASR